MTALEHPIVSLGLKSIRVVSGRSWVEIPFKSTSIFKQKNLRLVWYHIYTHIYCMSYLKVRMYVMKCKLFYNKKLS